MKGERLGEFEEMVLLAACSLGDGAYGAAIQQHLEEVAGRSATIGAVYSALDRLERKGHLTSWVGGATEERGGRRKRFFEATEAGVEALARARTARDALRRRIESADPGRGR